MIRSAIDYMQKVAGDIDPLNRLWPTGFAQLRTLLGDLNKAVAFGSTPIPEAVDQFFTAASQSVRAPLKRAPDATRNPATSPPGNSPGGPAKKGPRRQRTLTRKQGSSIAGYLFLAPWFLGLFGLVLGPMIATAYLSFTQYDLFSEPQWVGLGNYTEILANDQTQAIGSCHANVLASVPLRLVFALGMAVVFDRAMPGERSTAQSCICPPCLAVAWVLPCCGASSSVEKVR